MRTRHFERKRQQGLTVVEMMVAGTVALVLLGGILQVYLSSKQTYRTQEALARLQENGRFALEFLVRDVRMAGYQGCPNVASVFPDPAPVTVRNRSATLTLSSASVCRGYRVDSDGDWSPAYAGPMSAPSGVVPGTDVVSVQFADCGVYLNADMNDITAPADAPITLPANACNFSTSDVLMISDCGSAQIFQADAVEMDADNGNIEIVASDNFVKVFTTNAQVLSLATRDYFIRLKTLSSGRTVPALYRRDLGSSPQELIEGVEDLELLFGEEDALTGNIAYIAGNAVTNWERVRSARINLLLQSVEDRVASAPQSYTFRGQRITPGDHRMRRVISATVQLRNRVI